MFQKSKVTKIQNIKILTEGVGQGNLLSTGKGRSMQRIASRSWLHSLLDNCISGTMQFIYSREEVMVEHVNRKWSITKLKIAKLL